MLMQCEKCRGDTDVNYDEDSEMAVCSICGGSFEVGHFVKKMLIETRSVIKNRKRTGFMHACMQCGTNREVKIVGTKAVCAVCGATMNVPPAVLNVLMGQGGSEVTDSTATDRPMIKFGSDKTKKKVSKAVKKTTKKKAPKKKATPKRKPGRPKKRK